MGGWYPQNHNGSHVVKNENRDKNVSHSRGRHWLKNLLHELSNLKARC